MRKILNTIFILIFTVWTVNQPARAYALPTVFMGSPMLMTLGGPVGFGLLVGLVGLYGLYLLIPDSDGNEIRVPLSTKPASVPPAPSAPATASSSTTYTYSYSSGGYTGTGTTPEAACANYAAVMTVNPLKSCGVYPMGTYGSCIMAQMNSGGACPAGPWDGNAYIYRGGGTTSCPAGYVLSSGTCTLSNPRQATPDKKCDMLLANGAFGYAADLDCPSGSTANGSKVQPLLRNNGGQIVIPGRDSQGRPVIIEITAPQNGSQINIKTSTQTDIGGQSAVQTQTVSVDPGTGQVSNTSSVVHPGSIVLPTTDTVPTTTTGTGTATDTPTTNQDPTKDPVITCGLPGTPACAIDDTGFANKDAVKDKITTATSQMDALKDAVSNSGNSLPSVGRDWMPSLLPGSAVACHPIPVTIAMSKGPMAGMTVTETIDPCPHFEIARQIFGWLLGIFTVWYIWRRFTGRPSLES